nr:hypothetical protein [Methylomarinum sp. Ch1-1]MDP4519467.1 hypothetical protein [Methylomarinum sp. Ch1-1]
MRRASAKVCRRRPALGPNGSFRAEGGAPTQSTVLPSDVLNSVKRIKNRCASYRQHTLPAPVGWIKRSGSTNVGRLREASRQKPPPEAKLVIVVSKRIAWRRITLQLHANIALPSDVSNSVKRIKNRCASYRQHTLPYPHR